MTFPTLAPIRGLVRPKPTAPKRWQQIYETIGALPIEEMTLQEIADKVGIHPRTASRHVRALGRHPRPSGRDFRGVDWAQSDIVIAKQLGITRQAVHQHRQRFGIPNATECRAKAKHD